MDDEALMFACFECITAFPSTEMLKEDPKPVACPFVNCPSCDSKREQKLQAILSWLDEYHMAFKDAKRWRKEFEKFLTNLLTPKR